MHSSLTSILLLAALGPRVLASPAPNAQTSSCSCPADKCFSSLRLSPSSAKVASSYCSSYINFTPTVTKTATATTVTTVVSAITVSQAAAPVTTTQTSNITPAPTTVSPTCTTVTDTVSVPFTTSVAYLSRSSAPGGNLNKRSASTALPAMLSSRCGTGKSFTSKISSACSCLLGTTKTVTSTSTRTSTSTKSATVTHSLAPTQTVLTTITLSTSTATDCQTARTTTTVIGNGVGQTCGVPISTYTTGGSITCPSAASPTQTNARFRIEGGANEGTIFDGPCIAAGPETVTTPSGNSHLCDGTNNNANPSPGGTMTTAIDAAGDQNGFGFDGTWSVQFSDYFITRIGDTSQTNNQYWGILRGLVYTNAGGCEEYNSPGEGLWAFDAFNANAYLQLSSEYAVVAPGQSVALQILATDGFGASPSAAGGASFAGQIADSNGNVVFNAPSTPGLEPALHLVDGAVPRPSTESFATEIEQDAEETPQRGEGHVGHDGRHGAGLLDPGRDEFRETVTPHILIDGDGDHERARDGFVGVDRVCRHLRKG
nr:hypothetical protein CFP56_76180 [Quercus suber]